MAVRSGLHELALCSGYGGFSLGFRLAGMEHRTVCHVERDAYAASVLVARMEDETLDRAPIWSDLVSFDGRPWRGRVDCVTAGFPCQPWSAAGQKRGLDDDRWLWPHIARVLGEVRPWLVLLENVPGLNRAGDGGGLSFVLSDLADLGFDAEWGLLSAASVGASHRRDRLWIAAVAHDDIDRLQALWREPADDRHARYDLDGSGRADVADTSRLDEREPHNEARAEPRERPRTDAGGRGGFPPRPDDALGWERWVAAGGPEPSVRRLADGPPAGLADALHLGGNGLVPRVAASALTQLARRLLEDRDD